MPCSDQTDNGASELRRRKSWRNRETCAAVVVALLALPGCTAYRAAHLPGEAMPGHEHRDQLWVGAHARVVYPDGKRTDGEITAVTDSTFTLGRVGNYGLEERTLRRAEVAAVEMEDQADVSSNLVAVLATVATLSAAFLVILVASHPMD